MKAGNAIFTALMLILGFVYLEIMDARINDLDKRITVIELQMNVQCYN